jgi:hypothetical protein
MIGSAGSRFRVPPSSTAPGSRPGLNDGLQGWMRFWHGDRGRVAAVSQFVDAV